jgi:hypothetical protein
LWNTLYRLGDHHFYTISPLFTLQTLPNRLISFPNNKNNNSIQNQESKSANTHKTIQTTSTAQTTTNKILIPFRSYPNKNQAFSSSIPFKFRNWSLHFRTSFDKFYKSIYLTSEGKSYTYSFLVANTTTFMLTLISNSSRNVLHFVPKFRVRFCSGIISS